MITVVSSVMILGVIGIFFGACLAYASKIFYVQLDPRVEKIADTLPGANCGACGAAGCFSYAEGVVAGTFPPNACTPGGKDVAAIIGEIMGCAVEEVTPMLAVVHCKGGRKEARQKFEYMGVQDCKAAMLLAGGNKACEYGCLGFGSCVAVCPFQAIEMGDNGLPVVYPELCTGCGLCVKACPRHIISLIPQTQKIYLACANPEKGKAVKGVCEVGCISCGICANKNNNPSGDIVMEGGLPRIDYHDNLRILPGATRCPSDSFVIEVDYPPVTYDADKCDGCEGKPKPLCVKICPSKGCLTFDTEQKKAVYDSDKCVGCELCISECPVVAFK
jgi:RnfABCDGE-type electron transport complex B subunit